MNNTEVTKDHLAKMSDYVIDGEIEKLRLKEVRPDATDVYFDDTEGRVFYFHDGKIKSQAVLEYCNDWSATGRLIAEYRIGLGENGMAYRHFNDGIPSIYSENKNPLRAICEVILMMSGKP